MKVPILILLNLLFVTVIALGQTQHQLSVSRYTTAVLTNAEADSILASATTVLKVNDGAGDVACNVTLSRNGAVGTFSQGDGSIDSPSEFTSLIALPGNIKVVIAINYCGKFIPNVIGCAPVPGRSLAVVRYTAAQEGILWAHEFGHNKGLNHRNDANAVMHETIESTHVAVNTVECNAYKTPLLSIARNIFQIDGDLPSSITGTMDIKKFVRLRFIHGVPYELAVKYSSEDVPKLVAMLKDRSEEPYWANIVTVLGIIGDERAFDAMVEFIERDREDISAAHYRAKTVAVMSLGYLINKTGNKKAIDYLRRGVEPEIWATRLGSNITLYHSNIAERNNDLAKYAILGLALSGNSEAARALQSLQGRTSIKAQQKFRIQISNLVAEALKEHKKITRQGLANYYK